MSNHRPPHQDIFPPPEPSSSGGNYAENGWLADALIPVWTAIGTWWSRTRGNLWLRRLFVAAIFVPMVAAYVYIFSVVWRISVIEVLAVLCLMAAAFAAVFMALPSPVIEAAAKYLKAIGRAWYLAAIGLGLVLIVVCPIVVITFFVGHAMGASWIEGLRDYVAPSMQFTMVAFCSLVWQAMKDGD